MCGICGIWNAADPARRARAHRRHARDHRPPRPGRRGRSTGRRRAGHAPARDHRPRGRRPADLERGRVGRRSSSTARSTTSASCAPSSSAGATASHPHRHRGARARLRGVGRRLLDRLGACSPSRSGTGAAGGCCSPATAWARSRSTTHRRGGQLLFGSELKALLAAGVPSDLDDAALEDYLALRYVPAPRTLFRSVRQLPAGHKMVISDDGCRGRALVAAALWPEARRSRSPKPPTTSRTSCAPPWSGAS